MSLCLRLVVVWFWCLASWAASKPQTATFVKDVPFPQPVSTQYTTEDRLLGAIFRRLEVDYEGVPYVLTDRGVGRPFDDRLALDQRFRPLVGKLARDIALYRGRLVYLFEDAWLSNAEAGYPYGRLPGGYQHLATAATGVVLLSGSTNLAAYYGGSLTPLPFGSPAGIHRIYARTNEFFTLSSNVVHRVSHTSIEPFHQAEDLTTLAFRGREMLVGTTNGYYGVDIDSGRLSFPLQTNLPCTQITTLQPATNGLWAGTTRGLFLQTGPAAFHYFASKRWLPDDHVIDLSLTPAGEIYVLTRLGLTKLEYRQMTLAEKAAHFDRKIRRRHIRYGFCSELRLRRPGDPTSAELIDTDNDGTWSSLYMASQAFRYAATGEEKARVNAWETFAAIERLQAINGLDGFPARTFERAGFRYADPDRWRAAPDAVWEWKGHTSSDEVTAQTFGYAVMYETAARTTAERSRLAAAYDRLASHIVRNNYHLIDVDGKPTLWGRWGPDYVNGYPATVVDRRLKSSEIIAYLQFAHYVTGKRIYRDRGYELLNEHGYLTNITNSMENIGPTPGVVHEGHDLGNEWNHSDDLLAFINYWTLYRFAFDDTLKKAYGQAIRDHWAIENKERNPLWNYIYGMTGEPVYDVAGSIWTLRRFPMDLVTWTVVNSHRQDLERLPANFRGQQTEQLLPADERPVMRWNGNPFILDGGNGGRTELAGDEFLLPYWMGRYLRFIQ